MNWFKSMFGAKYGDRNATDAVTHQFCSVFTYGGHLYLGRQADALGSRKLLFPPDELDGEIDDAVLSQTILSALDEFGSLGHQIYAEEWEKLTRELLHFFGERSVSVFERKKKEVTIRRDLDSGEISLFGSDPTPNEDRIVVSATDLGQQVRKLLGAERVTD